MKTWGRVWVSRRGSGILEGLGRTFRRGHGVRDRVVRDRTGKRRSSRRDRFEMGRGGIRHRQRGLRVEVVGLRPEMRGIGGGGGGWQS